MPIDYADYHPEWLSRIRPAILERAGDHCENCGVRNHEWIVRWKINPAVYTYLDTATKPGLSFVSETWFKPICVVLTVAHVDHDRTNNDYANLRAWCQRCHLLHDWNQRRKESHENKNPPHTA